MQKLSTVYTFTVGLATVAVTVLNFNKEDLNRSVSDDLVIVSANVNDGETEKSYTYGELTRNGWYKPTAQIPECRKWEITATTVADDALQANVGQLTRVG